MRFAPERVKAGAGSFWEGSLALPEIGEADTQLYYREAGQGQPLVRCIARYTRDEKPPSLRS